MSLNLTKKLEHFSEPSGPSIPYMAIYFFKKFDLISEPSGPSRAHIYLSRSY